MHRILALDLSTKNIGYTFALGEEYQFGGSVELQGDLLDTCLTMATRWLNAVMEDMQPTVVAIEEPWPHRGNHRVDRMLARACGHAEAVARLHDAQVVLVHPSTVKATTFSKDRIRHTARAIGKTTITGHEADSVGIWHATLGVLQSERFEEQANE